MEELETLIFDLIVHSGNARGLLYEALDYAEQENYDQIEELMKQAETEMVRAHNIQSTLIQKDLQGKEAISLLLVHAQDQFMSTMTEQALIERLIKMQKQLNQLK